MSFLKNTLKKNKTTNTGDLAEVLKHALKNVGIFYYDIKVDLKNGYIYVCDVPNNIEVENRQVFSNAYHVKAKTVIRSHLPSEYRLLPQEEIQLEHDENSKRMVIRFESVESKRIDGSHVKTTDYKIQIMKDEFWDISKEPHAIISGVTGSGKSMFINYLFKQFSYLGARIYTIDPKYADLYMISKKKLNDSQYSADIKKSLGILKHLNELLTRRQKLLSAQNKLGLDAYQDKMVPIVLFFDELAAFKDSLTDKKDKDAYNSYLKNLVLKGRSAGINIILSLQKPLAEDIPTSVRDQLSFRVVLGKNTNDDTKKLIFGEKDKNVVVNDETERHDEWETASLKRFDGWYKLPTMTENFRVFETPDLKKLEI